MKIEIPVRWAEVMNDPDSQEERKLRRLIDGGDDEDNYANENVKYTYDDLVLDTDDIRVFHRFDDEHFILKTYEGDAYCVHIPYEEFKAFYQERLGSSIVELHMVDIEFVPEKEDNEEEE